MFGFSKAEIHGISVSKIKVQPSIMTLLRMNILISEFSLQFIVNPCLCEVCGDPLPWSCDRLLQLIGRTEREREKERERYTWYVLPVVTQLLCLSSSPPPPSFMGHMVSQGKNTAWQSTRKGHPPFNACCTGYLQYNGREHLQADLWNTVPLLTRFLSGCNNVWTYSLPGKIIRMKMHACCYNVGETVRIGATQIKHHSNLISSKWYFALMFFWHTSVALIEYQSTALL